MGLDWSGNAGRAVVRCGMGLFQALISGPVRSGSGMAVRGNVCSGMVKDLPVVVNRYFYVCICIFDYRGRLYGYRLACEPRKVEVVERSSRFLG